jgi:hypothetical protein
VAPKNGYTRIPAPPSRSRRYEGNERDVGYLECSLWRQAVYASLRHRPEYQPARYCPRPIAPPSSRRRTAPRAIGITSVAKTSTSWRGRHLSARSRRAWASPTWHSQSSVVAPEFPFLDGVLGSDPSQVRRLNQLLCASRPKVYPSYYGFEGRSRRLLLSEMPMPHEDVETPMFMDP